MKILPLSDRKIIEISGKDCLEFLQGLITVDIYKLSLETALWGGLLSPQGKALFDFFCYTIPNKQDTVLIDIHHSKTDEFIEHIQKYILRSDVAITPNNDLNIYAIWDNHAHASAIWNNDSILFDNNAFALQDPRSAEMGYRYIVSQHQNTEFLENHKNKIVEYDEYQALRINYNIVDPTVDMPNMDYYWLEINASEFNGVDFEKGCYVGQEVTARMKHKTVLKRQIIPVYVLGNPATPAEMKTDVKDIGTLVCLDTWTGKGLAYVYINRWEDAIETLRSITIGMCMVKKVA